VVFERVGETMEEVLEMMNGAERYFCHGCERNLDVMSVVGRYESGELECLLCHSTCVELLEDEPSGATHSHEQHTQRTTEPHGYDENRPARNHAQFERGGNHGDENTHADAGLHVTFLIAEHDGASVLILTPGTVPGQVESVLGNYTFGSDADFARLMEHLMQNDPNQYGAPRASEKAIAALPREAWNGETCGSACAVCQDDWNADSRVIRMPCGHVYCESCIVPWLQLHNSCPTCRSELVNPADDDNDEREEKQRTRRASDRTNAHGRQGSTPASPHDPAGSSGSQQRPWWHLWSP